MHVVLYLSTSLLVAGALWAGIIMKGIHIIVYYMTKAGDVDVCKEDTYI